MELAFATREGEHWPSPTPGELLADEGGVVREKEGEPREPGKSMEQTPFLQAEVLRQGIEVLGDHRLP